jgi:hypothetical protein
VYLIFTVRYKLNDCDWLLWENPTTQNPDPHICCRVMRQNNNGQILIWIWSMIDMSIKIIKILRQNYIFIPLT